MTDFLPAAAAPDLPGAALPERTSCPSCGAEVTSAERFCEACGAPLTPTVDVVVEPAAGERPIELSRPVTATAAPQSPAALAAR